MVAFASDERLRVLARVQRQRAAAARQARHVDLEALGGEHAGGGLVHMGEEHALDAALEQRDRSAPLAARLEALGQPRQRAP